MSKLADMVNKVMGVHFEQEPLDFLKRVGFVECSTLKTTPRYVLMERGTTRIRYDTETEKIVDIYKLGVLKRRS